MFLKTYRYYLLTYLISYIYNLFRIRIILIENFSFMKERRAAMDVLNNEVLVAFVEINKAINKLVKLDAERLGITAVQLKALYKVDRNPNISLGDLAEMLRLTNSTVSGVIERLVHNGLVDRVVPPENRRTVSIHLTEKGRRTLNQFYASGSILVNKLNEVLELPEEERSQLIHLLKIVLAKLSIEEELN